MYKGVGGWEVVGGGREVAGVGKKLKAGYTFH